MAESKRERGVRFPISRARYKREHATCLSDEPPARLEERRFSVVAVLGPVDCEEL